MTNNDFKMMSLGKQGLFVHDHLSSKEMRRYLNLLVQTVQLECGNMVLQDITLDMGNNLLNIVYDNDELLAELAPEKEVK